MQFVCHVLINGYQELKVKTDLSGAIHPPPPQSFSDVQGNKLIFIFLSYFIQWFITYSVM